MRNILGKWSIEAYEDFKENPSDRDLSLHQLRQTMRMHGFACTNLSKKVLIDALHAIELQNLVRSTLKENISNSAFLAVNQVKNDLNALKWEECSIQSIRILKSVEKENYSDLSSGTSRKTPKRNKKQKIQKTVESDSV